MQTPTATEPLEVPGDPETLLCLGCLSPNPVAAHFCARCGAPMTSYAATAPFESVFAEGHAYRNAVAHPRSWVVLLGIWLIFGASGLGGLAVSGVVWTVGLGPGERVLGFLLSLWTAVISSAILFKTTQNYRKQRHASTHAGIPAEESTASPTAR